jgi:hypothetical protein
VKWIALGVGTRQLRRSIGVHGTEHVVIREEMVKTQVLDSSPNPPNRGRIASKLVLRIDDADLHGALACQTMSRRENVSHRTISQVTAR